MSDSRSDSRPPADPTTVEADALLGRADAMLKEQDVALRRLAAASERVEQATQRLAQGDGGRDVSVALRQAVRDLTDHDRASWFKVGGV